MSKEAYDMVIVGAGAADCVVASYLAEHTDASIALIEAGGLDRDPFSHIPDGFADMLAHDRKVWKYETIPQHGARRACRSRKVPCGGSSINAMACVRGQARDYAAWQDAVGAAGRRSYEDLLPVFIAPDRRRAAASRRFPVGIRRTGTSARWSTQDSGSAGSMAFG